MVLQINSVHQLAATAAGVDGGGNPVQVNVTAYVINAGNDATVAVAVVQTQVLNEAVIPDGSGGFTKPTLVTATSVQPIDVLVVAPLVYLHAATDAKFSVNEIYQVQILASVVDSSITVTVYPLNLGLTDSLALGESDVSQMSVVPDPFVPGQLDQPQTVTALSGTPTTSAPLSNPILHRLFSPEPPPGGLHNHQI
jgi:hypothetical protein